MARWQTDVEVGLMDANELQKMSTEMETQLWDMKAELDKVDQERSMDTNFGDIARQLSREAETRTKHLSDLLDQLASELKSIQMRYWEEDEKARNAMLGAAN